MLDLLKKRILSIYTLTSGFCIVLITIRVLYTNHITFLFLVWNLFLAWIPFLISEYLTYPKPLKKYSLLALSCLWLLFFPNAPYILTDLIHLKPRLEAPFWFDLVLLLSFAWAGILLGFKSLYNMQKIVQKFYGKQKALILIMVCLFISGYGIYLGRFQRFNSWDILTNPSSLFFEIKDTITNPLLNIETYGITFLFGLFLIVGYFSIINLKKSIV